MNIIMKKADLVDLLTNKLDELFSGVNDTELDAELTELLKKAKPLKEMVETFLLSVETAEVMSVDVKQAKRKNNIFHKVFKTRASTMLQKRLSDLQALYQDINDQSTEIIELIDSLNSSSNFVVGHTAKWKLFNKCVELYLPCVVRGSHGLAHEPVINIIDGEITIDVYRRNMAVMSEGKDLQEMLEYVTKCPDGVDVQLSEKETKLLTKSC